MGPAGDSEHDALRRGSSAGDDLIIATDRGLYCPPGDFYIDPWRPGEHESGGVRVPAIERAVLTHAHSDHARAGARSYLAADRGVGVLRRRLREDAPIQGIPFGERVTMPGIGKGARSDVTVSLHPAGHVLGSAQVRVEHAGEVLVVTGDYKTEHDATCDGFELVPCDTFITECTFGLPIYRWPAQAAVAGELNEWWSKNADEGRTSIIYAYALGKAQRVLSMLDPSIGPILLHGAVASMVEAYREADVALPETEHASAERIKELKREAGGSGTRAIVVAPMSANGSTWVTKFRPFSASFASGWMMVRGARRRRAVDRGFVISDHVDWPSLNRVINETGASRVGFMHGSTAAMTRWIAESRPGVDAFVVKTRYDDEEPETNAPDPTGDGDEDAGPPGLLAREGDP